jgi:hypothetical protein
LYLRNQVDILLYRDHISPQHPQAHPRRLHLWILTPSPRSLQKTPMEDVVFYLQNEIGVYRQIFASFVANTVSPHPVHWNREMDHAVSNWGASFGVTNTTFRSDTNEWQTSATRSCLPCGS